MYESKENIDVVFLGSSHVYRSYNPQIADDLLQQKTFNAGSSAQTMNTSYYLLLEICKYHHVKEVYLDTYYALTNQVKDDESVYYISDYMKFSINKMFFLYDSGGEQRLLFGLFTFRRNLSNLEHIFDNIRSRFSALKDYSLVCSDDELYKGNGFVYSNISVDDVRKLDFSSCKEYDYTNGVPVDSCYYEYLVKIIEYCKTNGIKLVLVDQPMLRQNLNSVRGYNQYVQFHYALSDANDIQYWNFNLYKDDLGLDYYHYKDIDHLNGEGATIYTRKFTDIVIKDRNGESVKELFCKVYNYSIN